MPVDSKYIVVQNSHTPMKRILALLFVLVVWSTPVFGQDELEKIKELVNTDSVHVPALLQAILQGETETVKTLIKEGEDVNEYWYYREDNPFWSIGYTPLELATRLGDLDIMRLLLDNGAETDRLIEGGIVTRSILGYAKNIEIAQLLLDHGADPAESLRSIDDVNIAQFFINNGADVNYNDEAGTPLHGAAAGGNTDMVQLLISNGADVNAWAEAGITPLHQARNAEIAQILIDNGADIHATSNAGTPLHTADNAEIAQVLINSGADVDAEDYYSAPLHEASYRSNKDVVQVLLDHGADVNARDYNGNTPLHKSAFYNTNTRITKILIDHGADVNAKDIDGRTPLDSAIDRGRTEIADLLREHGGVATK